MALTSTLRRFEIELCDSDRGLYETLEFRVAQHPSESTKFLVARVMARCLEHTEGLDFGAGLSSDDEPALRVVDLQGRTRAAIEIGQPSIDRLHRASKATERVVVYGWKDPAGLYRDALAKGIHRAEKLEVVALPEAFLEQAGKSLSRAHRWTLTVSGGQLWLALPEPTLEATVIRLGPQV